MARRKPNTELSERYAAKLARTLANTGLTPYQLRKQGGIERGLSPTQAVGKPKRGELNAATIRAVQKVVTKPVKSLSPDYVRRIAKGLAKGKTKQESTGKYAPTQLPPSARRKILANPRRYPVFYRALTVGTPDDIALLAKCWHKDHDENPRNPDFIELATRMAHIIGSGPPKQGPDKKNSTKGLVHTAKGDYVFILVFRHGKWRVINASTGTQYYESVSWEDANAIFLELTEDRGSDIDDDSYDDE